MQQVQNPNKQREIQAEFDSRLFGLCAEFRRRLGVINVASTLVVHAAKFCSELGEQFEEVAIERWKSTTKEFRDELEQKAAKVGTGHEKQH